MTLEAANVRVAVTGAVSVGALGATAPTSSTSAITPRVDVGYIGEDGVTLSYPGAGDSTPIKAWQNGATVRTLRAAPDDVPTITFMMLETKKEVIEFQLGVTVTQTVTEGSYEYDSTAVRVPNDLVLDVVDDAELIRVHVPEGTVTEIGDLVYANGAPIGYPVTVACDRNSDAGYNLKTWATALKS